MIPDANRIRWGMGAGKSGSRGAHLIRGHTTDRPRHSKLTLSNNCEVPESAAKPRNPYSDARHQHHQSRIVRHTGASTFHPPENKMRLSSFGFVAFHASFLAHWPHRGNRRTRCGRIRAYCCSHYHRFQDIGSQRAHYPHIQYTSRSPPDLDFNTELGTGKQENRKPYSPDIGFLL